ncbi:MAG: phosphoribosylamine--glycine [Chitinophagaceae bacterium]|nr:MAG: phosphoribosylamine--glycine [Chitinophagaceae bacterium]
MNILLLGSGGREHALAWKMVQSHHCDQLYIAPGNAGTTQFGINLPISVTDFPAIKAACIEYRINMLVVGPEEPLVKGIYDFFQADPVIISLPQDMQNLQRRILRKAPPIFVSTPYLLY